MGVPVAASMVGIVRPDEVWELKRSLGWWKEEAFVCFPP